MDKVYNDTIEPSVSRLSSERIIETVAVDNTRPPAYHELPAIIPHPFMPESNLIQSMPLFSNSELEQLGVPLSDFGVIKQVVYGNREAEQFDFCCCCCFQDPYLYIPDNFILNLDDHKLIGILCPKCRTGIIKLGFIRESCDEKRIQVCLHCKTVYSKLPRS